MVLSTVNETHCVRDGSWLFPGCAPYKGGSGARGPPACEDKRRLGNSYHMRMYANGVAFLQLFDRAAMASARPLRPSACGQPGVVKRARAPTLGRPLARACVRGPRRLAAYSTTLVLPLRLMGPKTAMCRFWGRVDSVRRVSCLDGDGGDYVRIWRVHPGSIYKHMYIFTR